MPSTTTYKFGDVVLVPFPFTDQTTRKQRPAVVISSAAYNRSRRDLILLAITSQRGSSSGRGEVEIARWREAGLLKPSVLKPIATTIERRLVRRKLGRLVKADAVRLERLLTSILGSG